MRQSISILAIGALTGTLAPAASASVVTLNAVLSGTQQVPANGSPGSGTAALTIDTSTLAYTLAVQFSGLTGNTAAAHIHRGPLGGNGPVILSLDGPGQIDLGVTSYSGSFSGTFPAGELSGLLAGNNYINLHTSTFGGGEIRGQLVPTPGAAAILGLAGLASLRRRRA